MNLEKLLFSAIAVIVLVFSNGAEAVWPPKPTTTPMPPMPCKWVHKCTWQKICD